MRPIKTPDCNFTFLLPGGTAENDLPCQRDEEAGTVTSFWAVEDTDDLHKAKNVGILVHGAPTLRVEVGWALDDMIDAQLGVVMGRHGNDGGCTVALDDESRVHLAENGTLILRAHTSGRIPPLSVYLVDC